MDINARDREEQRRIRREERRKIERSKFVKFRAILVFDIILVVLWVSFAIYVIIYMIGKLGPETGIRLRYVVLYLLLMGSITTLMVLIWGSLTANRARIRTYFICTIFFLILMLFDVMYLIYEGLNCRKEDKHIVVCFHVPVISLLLMFITSVLFMVCVQIWKHIVLRERVQDPKAKNAFWWLSGFKAPSGSQSKSSSTKRSRFKRHYVNNLITVDTDIETVNSMGSELSLYKQHNIYTDPSTIHTVDSDGPHDVSPPVLPPAEPKITKDKSTVEAKKETSVAVKVADLPSNSGPPPLPRTAPSPPLDPSPAPKSNSTYTISSASPDIISITSENSIH